jgi:hypothetical protein
MHHQQRPLRPQICMERPYWMHASSCGIGWHPSTRLLVSKQVCQLWQQRLGCDASTCARMASISSQISLERVEASLSITLSMVLLQPRLKWTVLPAIGGVAVLTLLWTLETPSIQPLTLVKLKEDLCRSGSRPSLTLSGLLMYSTQIGVLEGAQEPLCLVCPALITQPGPLNMRPMRFDQPTLAMDAMCC